MECKFQDEEVGYVAGQDVKERRQRIRNFAQARGQLIVQVGYALSSKAKHREDQ
jgi:hypothetical protein